jgi:maltose alpha-D-glucosyltransferase/alpha-amylase
MAIAEAVQIQLVAALEALRQAAPSLPPESSDLAGQLLERADDLPPRIAALAATAVGAQRTRIHGDLHLGQVLVAGGDVMIIDFEGEPAKPLAQRRAKQLPLRDVAGMLRSFDYAAARVGRDLPTTAPSGRTKAAARLERFRILAAESFLRGYADGGGLIDEPLLRLLQLEKAAYEVVYEAANRPDWLAVPLRGLANLASGLLARESDQ